METSARPICTLLLTLAALGSARTAFDGSPPRPVAPRVDRPLAVTPIPRAPFAFQDVSAAAGIADIGISYGASAGDCDGDGWVDIFTSGHYTAHPRLWRNQGNGTFVDIAAAAMQPSPSGDMHAAQWMDIDNDGQQELMLLRGASYGLGSTPKLLYRRSGNQLVDIAASVGLSIPLMRARTPLAFDFDRDGHLDVFVAALLRPDGLAPPSLLVQHAGQFKDVGPGHGMSLQSHTEFGVVGDLDGDHAVDVLFGCMPNRVFALSGGAAADITSTIGWPQSPTMNDAVIADFTGDGENEVYVARASSGSDFHREGALMVEFCARVAAAEHGVRFAVPGPHVLWLDWEPLNFWPVSSVFVGAQGLRPVAYGFALDPADPANAGIAPHVPGQDVGIYIGWDATAQEWSISCSAPWPIEALVRAIASAPIGVPYAVGFNPNASPADLLLTRVGGQYIDITAASGIPASLRGRSAVAADFDNDMDLDLYVMTSTITHNTDNVLLENLGDGTFVAVPAGDAVGSAGGVGDVAITLDYDQDGFVDLFLVNGASTAFRQAWPFAAFGDDGPAQLLRNTTGNGNHWLAVDLVGTASNRDGIGARLELTAGGVTQVRENGGGMHRYAQNHGLHFGLGDHASALRLEVWWPSGVHTVLHNIAADQRLTVIE